MWYGWGSDLRPFSDSTRPSPPGGCLDSWYQMVHGVTDVFPYYDTPGRVNRGSGQRTSWKQTKTIIQKQGN